MDHIDENSLDSYIENLEKKTIMVPDDLEARILNRIDEVELKRKKLAQRRIRSILASCAAVFILFAVSVKWVPGFAAYASGIPVIKYAVNFLQGDSGTELAKKQGYPELKPVSIQQNGYTLTIDHIMFDEDRLVMTVRAFGEQIEALLSQADEHDKPARVGSETEIIPSPHISLNVLDFENTGFTSAHYQPTDREKGYAIRAETVFEEGQVREFLAGNPEFLTMSAKIYILTPGRVHQVLQTFENIKIPLQPEMVLLSKKFLPEKTISVEQTDITVNRLTISPTRMRMDVSFSMPEGYFFSGFENPYLKDSEGNIYKPEGLVSRNYTETERSLYFVPSIYFDDDNHQEIYFGFDGIRIGAVAGKTINFSVGDNYPRQIQYMGQELIIEEVTYSSSREQELQVVMRIPRKLKIDGLNIEGAKSQSMGHSDALDDHGRPLPDTFGVGVEYRPVYKAEFNFPGLLISSPHEIEISRK